MINEHIYLILSPIKTAAIKKVREVIDPQRSKNIIKSACPEINVWGSVERTVSTSLGLKLQEIATLSPKNVINLDKTAKQRGLDIQIDSVWEGQLKSSYNTQTGTHQKDAIRMLTESTTIRHTYPFFAVAFGDSYDYMQDGVRYFSGEAFWSFIQINYTDMRETTIKLIKDIRREVLSELNAPQGRLL